MRNLKRVLSLGMTAAMISGLMVSAGAAGYTDVTAEDNVEAIEVLQAVGVMVGDESGKFNPDQKVTRNEMAVIMSNLMDYRVATYAGTSPFTDVPSWAEQYVAACYANGIVAGTSATTFGGNDSVTAGQAALMLMKALGYFQYSSDFGSDWLLATTQVGTRINLFNGVEAGVREAMTRNDVAQLVLNTLKSTMVDAENNNISVDTEGTSITLGNTKYYYRVRTGGTDTKYDAINDNKTATGIDNATGTTLELGEELYEGDLKVYDTTDSYGRPATEWKYKLDVIGTYPDDALAVYNTKVSRDELYNLLGNNIVSKLKSGANKLEVYALDGDTVVASGSGVVTNYMERNSTAAAGVSYTNAVAGKGVQTEVYLDSDGNVTIVYINTYLMRATDDYNADKGVLSVEVLTSAKQFGGSDPKNATQLNDDEFDIKNYKEGDYILYTVGGSNGDEIISVAPAKVVTGKVDSYSQGSYVTLDGTKYEYAAQVDGAKTYNNDTYRDSAATQYRVGDTASVVVDNNGYVLYVDSAKISLGNYLFIADLNATAGTFGDVTKAKVCFADGTSKEVEIDTNGDAAAINTWYSYSVNSSGQYKLSKPVVGDPTPTTKDYVDPVSHSTTSVKGDRADFTGSGSTMLGNDNSVLVVYHDKEYKAYTGVKNFPEISGGSVTVYALKDETTGYVTVAYVDASAAGVTVDDNSQDALTIFLKKTSTYVDSTDNEAIYKWDVIMDGEVKSIETKDATISAGQVYVNLDIDKDGFYEAGDLFTTKNDCKTGVLSGTLEVEGNSLKMSGMSNYIVTSDTEIVVVMRPVGSSKLDTEIMVDAAASWESKTVTGKQLDNMFDGYTVSGNYYLVATAKDGDVIETLYLDVNSAT